MKKIKLTQGKYATVDDDMYAFLNQFKWYAWKSKKMFYARRGFKIDGKVTSLFMHFFIIGKGTNGKMADHINGDGLDNRISNLRIVTNRENSSNRKNRREGKTTSRYVGVSWYKRDKRWQSQIRIHGKSIHLGRFDNEKQASNVYLQAVKERRK